MTDVNLDVFKQILELGWPAIITVFFGYLAITYLRDMKEQIQWLRKRIDDLEARTDQVEAFTRNPG